MKFLRGRAVRRFLASAAVVAALCLSFFWPGSHGQEASPEGTDPPAVALPGVGGGDTLSPEEPVSSEPWAPPDVPPSSKGGEGTDGYQGDGYDGSGQKNKPTTEPAQPASPLTEKPPTEPPSPALVSDEALICSLVIRCDALLPRLDELPSGKRDIVPEDGVLLKSESVAFEERDSVFDVLRREAKAAGLPVDFLRMPVTGTAYIKGIGNLYEFDCGDLSGWHYRVNGAFPNLSCSDVAVANGDEIAFVYSCDLGRDIANDWRAAP